MLYISVFRSSPSIGELFLWCDGNGCAAIGKAIEIGALHILLKSTSTVAYSRFHMNKLQIVEWALPTDLTPRLFEQLWALPTLLKIAVKPKMRWFSCQKNILDLFRSSSGLRCCSLDSLL